MSKRLITPIAVAPPVDYDWLDVGSAAVVEVTSEDRIYPIESALPSSGGRGWRAAGPGPQTIRLLLNKPQKLQRIHLDFKEAEVARMQEFVLRWSPDNSKSYREVVRQQWNFSPPGTVREREEYAVEIFDVTVLELSICPTRAAGEPRASLLNLRLA